MENKIPDTRLFILLSFDATMKEAKKSLASKTEIDNAVDLGNKS